MLTAARLANVLTSGDGSCLYWAFAASSGLLPPEAIAETPFGRKDEKQAAAMEWMTTTRERVVKYIDVNREMHLSRQHRAVGRVADRWSPHSTVCQHHGTPIQLG